MTWRDLVRVCDPTISDELADNILWNETAFPSNTVGGTFKQIRSAVRALNNGIERCECCGWKDPFHVRDCPNETGRIR